MEIKHRRWKRAISEVKQKKKSQTKYKNNFKKPNQTKNQTCNTEL